MTPPLRFHTNFGAAALCGESRCSAKAVQTRRLLALAAIYTRATRGPAAQSGEQGAIGVMEPLAGVALGQFNAVVNGGAKRDHRGGVRRDRLAAAGLSP